MDAATKNPNAAENKDKDHGRDKEVAIVVNGRAKTVAEKEISFDEVVKLAFPTPPAGENILYTVNYRRGEGNKQGSLVEGQAIKVKEGMIFDVTATDRS